MSKRISLQRGIERLNTRDAENNPVIEGYFAVFNKEYEEFPGAVETIAPGAFSRSIAENDIRALINHDSTLVLARNTAGTLELEEDGYGLYGRIRINPNDTDALNLHSRIERRDVTQASFGFFVREKETEFLEDGTVRWTITDADLLEISPCTFPAYPDTNLSARDVESLEGLEARKAEAWRERLHHKLTGGKTNAKDSNAQEEG